MMELDIMLKGLKRGQIIPDEFLNPPDDPIQRGDPRCLDDYIEYFQHPLPFVNTRMYLRTIRCIQKADDPTLAELNEQVLSASRDYSGPVDLQDVERLLRAVRKGHNITDKLISYHGKVLTVATALQSLRAAETSPCRGYVTRSSSKPKNHDASNGK